jgi:hypothetical protein
MELPGGGGHSLWTIDGLATYVGTRFGGGLRWDADLEGGCAGAAGSGSEYLVTALARMLSSGSLRPHTLP